MMNRTLVKFTVALLIVGTFLSNTTLALATSPEKLTIPVSGAYVLLPI